MSHDPHKDWTMKAWIAGFLLLITIAVLLIANANGCGVQGRKKVVLTDPPAPPTSTPTVPDGDGSDDTGQPSASCDGLALGDTKEEICAGGNGKRKFVCSSDGLVKVSDTCSDAGPCGAGAVTFAAVEPILTKSCAGCHTGFNTPEVARAKIDEFLRRTALPSDNSQHMPRGGDLSAAERSTLADWKTDGFCAAPTTTPGRDVPPGPVGASLDSLEQRMLDDLTNVEARLRKNQRYLVATHAPANAEPTFKSAAVKSTNSLSQERQIQGVVAVDPGLYRIDLDKLGMTSDDWRLIEDSDKLHIESFTARGSLLKLVAHTRKPWFHVDNFGETTLRNSGVYYALTRTPQTFDELAAKVGVKYAEDLRDFDALLAGFVGSPLSTQNRLVHRTESRDGSMWITYDTGPQNGDVLKNLFQFPLLPDVGGQRNFKFVAGEVIYDLPNGLHGYALYQASLRRVGPTQAPVLQSFLDKRLDAADPNVVHDFLSPISAIITAGNSCFRCHSGGILPFKDQIRDHVLSNGAEFGADKDLILAIYHGATAVSDAVSTSNKSYAAALAPVGADPTAADPITIVSDRFLNAWDLEKTARFLFMTPEALKAGIEQSANASAQVGQLRSGGTITYDQLVQSMPVLIQELRLFKDPLAN